MRSKNEVFEYLFVWFYSDMFVSVIELYDQKVEYSVFETSLSPDGSSTPPPLPLHDNC